MKFRSSSDVHNVALFDIGSGSVGTAIVKLAPHKKPYMLYAGRTPFSYQENPSFEQLTKSMLSTLLDNGLKMQTEGTMALSSRSSNGSIDSVAGFYSSPWHIIQAKSFNKSEDKPFVINKQFLADLTKKERDAFLKQSEKDQGVEKAELIELQIVQLELNGYPSSDPFGKSVKNAKIGLVMSAIPQNVCEKTKEVFTQLAQKKKNTFYTMTMATYHVVRDLFSQDEDFLIIDISAEITDVSVVQRGSLIATASFPVGYNYLIRHISHTHNTVPEEVYSLVRTYSEEDGSDELSKRLASDLEQVASTWIESFSQVSSKLGQEIAIPHKVFMSSHNAFLPWFSKTLQSEELKELVFPESPFEVQLLAENVLRESVDVDESISQFDPFLAIQALFLNRIFLDENT